MTQEKRQLLYLGEDITLYEDIISFYGEINIEVDIDRISYAPYELCKYLSQKSPSVVYLDLTSIKLKEELLCELNFCHALSKSSSTLYASIFDNQLDNGLKGLYLTSGVHITHSKGSELKTFLFDSYTMGFNEDSTVFSFAKAEEINLKLSMGVLSAVTRIQDEEFRVVTDLDLQQDEVSIETSIFPQLSYRQLDILNRNLPALSYPMMHSSTIKFPLASPWEEITEESIQKETVENWLDINKDELNYNNDCFYVFTRNDESLYPLYHQYVTEHYHPFVKDNANIPKLAQELPENEPPIIFYDLNLEGHELTLDDFANIINIIKDNPGYEPILVLCNNPSKSEAIQKVFGYQNIICLKKALNENILNLFINHYREKSDHMTPTYFKIDDPRRVIAIQQEVMVKSLTEHEITFECEQEIPYYSVLHFHLPLKMYATVIPTDQSEQSVTSNIYTAVLHGLSEQENQRIRLFVNQIIYSPLKSFTEGEVELIFKMNNTRLKDDDEMQQENDSETNVNIKVKTNDEKKDEKDIKKSFKKKSKL